MDTNKYISTLYPTGTYLSSPKYKHKQCGEYLNDNFLATRMISSSYSSKRALVDKYGFKADFNKVQVGDIVVLDYGTATGHIAIVNSKDSQARNIRMTDCNLVKLGTVNNDFYSWINDSVWKRIYGFARLPLNAKTLAGQPNRNTIPEWAKEAVEKAKAQKIIMNWDDPWEAIGGEKLEWIFENLGWLDKNKHEGKMSLVRLAVMLHQQGIIK